MNKGEPGPRRLPTLVEIFDHLREHRRDARGKKLSMVEIAIHGPGVSVDTLYSISSGRIVNPTMDTIIAISRAFRVPPIYLMPTLWGMEFDLPPDMEGFPPFPRHDQFNPSPTDE